MDPTRTSSADQPDDSSRGRPAAWNRPARPPERLLAWLARGRKNLVTFFAEDELDFAAKAGKLGRALVALSDRDHKSALLATIDGAPAPESPLAKALVPHGFASRQGQLVRLRQG